ncbi:MAG: hypothetical protein GQ527_02550 [Bacteroidales bacterium]|nr:hypothetical protein [Bacteroidales bacterium]
MTNEAIILIENPTNSKGSSPKPSPLSKVNNHPFLHYQLQFLDENIFEHIVIMVNGDTENYKKEFGEKYLDIHIEYLKYDPELKSTGNILKALNSISSPMVFIIKGSSYFRLNYKKADDFRRMRNSRLLLISKQMEDVSHFEEIKLNEKGQIKAIGGLGENSGLGAINTDYFLVNTRYFRTQFAEKKGMLFEDYFKTSYQDEPLFSFVCKQYFIDIQNQKDIEKAKDDFKENYF